MRFSRLPAEYKLSRAANGQSAMQTACSDFALYRMDEKRARQLTWIWVSVLLSLFIRTHPHPAAAPWKLLFHVGVFPLNLYFAQPRKVFERTLFAEVYF